MLKDNCIQFCGAFKQRVELTFVAMLRNPQLDAHHRAIPDAAVQFIKARLRMPGVEIDKTKRTPGKMAQRSQHFIILLS